MQQTERMGQIKYVRLCQSQPGLPTKSRSKGKGPKQLQGQRAKAAAANLGHRVLFEDLLADFSQPSLGQKQRLEVTVQPDLGVHGGLHTQPPPHPPTAGVSARLRSKRLRRQRGRAAGRATTPGSAGGPGAGA